MIKIKKLIKKSMLIEGIIDGITASFIIDSGLNESSVKGRKASLALPRYSVWGFHSEGNGVPKLMENGYDINKLMEKYNISEEDVYLMEGNIRETIKKVGKNKWAVYSKKGGKRLGTHDSKESAKNQLAAIEINKTKNKKESKTSLNG